MKHQGNRRAKVSNALTVVRVVEDEGGETTPRGCPLCGGPTPLCGGIPRCTAGRSAPLELRWLTAIRAVYAGLVLTRTLSALWGGALLRFARQLALGALASGSPPPSIARLAAEHADPGCAVSGSVVAGLALAYAQNGDLERLSELSRALRDAQAPWLVELGLVGPRAAMATPLDRERFALLAVLCDDCARDATLPLDQLYEPVATYDAAICCPRCGALSPHPLPGVTLGAPHPVGRCVPGAGAAARVCRIHHGDEPSYELDREGLCVEGRRTFDRAVLDVAKLGRASTPFERDLVHALVRARRGALNARIDDDAMARSMVTSPVLMPFFAALAATNPDAARDLAQIAGAPLDTNAADPSVLAAMSAGGGLAGLLAIGRSALTNLRASLSRAPRGLAPPRPPPKRHRRKKSQR
jgi:hypothetical protein